MESFNESSLSAYFTGLVDVCTNDDGQLVYMILKDGELILTPEHSTETENFSIPEKKLNLPQNSRHVISINIG